MCGATAANGATASRSNHSAARINFEETLKKLEKAENQKKLLDMDKEKAEKNIDEVNNTTPENVNELNNITPENIEKAPENVITINNEEGPESASTRMQLPVDETHDDVPNDDLVISKINMPNDSSVNSTPTSTQLSTKCTHDGVEGAGSTPAGIQLFCQSSVPVDKTHILHDNDMSIHDDENILVNTNIPDGENIPHADLVSTNINILNEGPDNQAINIPNNGPISSLNDDALHSNGNIPNDGPTTSSNRFGILFGRDEENRLTNLLEEKGLKDLDAANETPPDGIVSTSISKIMPPALPQEPNNNIDANSLDEDFEEGSRLNHDSSSSDDSLASSSSNSTDSSSSDGNSDSTDSTGGTSSDSDSGRADKNIN